VKLRHGIAVIFVIFYGVLRDVKNMRDLVYSVHRGSWCNNESVTGCSV